MAPCITKSALSSELLLGFLGVRHGTESWFSCFAVTKQRGVRFRT